MKHSVWSKLLPYESNEETETEHRLCGAEAQYLWRGARPALLAAALHGSPALLAAALAWEPCTRHSMLQGQRVEDWKSESPH